MVNYLKWSLGIIVIGIMVYLVLHQAGLDGIQTHSISNRITDFVMKIIVRIHGRPERSYGEVSLIIRKLAHFMEYFLYVTAVFIIINFLIRKWFIGIPLSLLLTLPIPYIDEVLIQSQTDGRAAHVLDLMIDYFALSIAIGIGILYMILSHFRGG